MDDLLTSVGTITELVMLYYTCMIKAGAEKDVALHLASEFQNYFLDTIIRSGNNKKEKEEGE